MRCLQRVFGRVTRFARATDGAATIEAVLWLPMFVMIVALLADVSMMFHGQTKMLRIAQDANRNMSVGRLTTTGETENFVLTRMASMSPNALAATTVTAGLVTTTVSVPINDLDLFGVAKIFDGARISVRTEHLLEN